jgi:dethiobiotin synthetase
MSEGVKDAGSEMCSAHERPRTQDPEAQRPRGLFVTGTDTGAGKTILSAALLAAIAAAGERVRAHKPVVTGLDEPPGEWPPDHELLALAAGMEPEDVAPLRYGPAVSPHLAAELAGERIDPAQLLAAARGADQAANFEERRVGHEIGGQGSTAESIVIVEGVGGLLVPLADRFTVLDLAARLGLPLLIAARPGLGTINHTLLTLDAARSAGIEVCAVVLTPWSARPSIIESSNRDTIARLGDVEVACLPHVPRAEIVALARVGGDLPWRRWLTPPAPRSANPYGP